MTSCPYNARYYNNVRKAVDKCDFCYASRLKEDGAVPACVEVCPNNVFIFGDLNNQEGEIYKRVHEIHKTVWVLRPEKGTMPNIFYVKN
jgi:protein NrfC